MKIGFAYADYCRIIKACKGAVSKDGIHKTLQYIELRGINNLCTATALDGFVLKQVQVPCYGEGNILIPPIKAPKCEKVEIYTSGNGKRRCVQFDFLYAGGELIFGYKKTLCEDAYVDWSKIMPGERTDDEYIYCNANNLRRALEGFDDGGDNVVCIGVPRNKIKPIILSSGDMQGAVLPVRVNDTRYGETLKPRNYKVLEEVRNG